MRVKKSIAIILTLIVMILPMMTIQSQAATLGKVYNLSSQMKGNVVYFSWNKVTGADGYDLYINTSNKGYEYIGSVNSTGVSVIGFKENETYFAKVRAYKIKNNGTKQVGSFSDEIKVNTTLEIANLGKVSTLTATQNGGNVTLNWSKVTNADGYQVFVNIPDFGYMNIGAVPTTSAIITGFQNGKTYEFKVRAYEKINNETINYGAFSPSRSLKINKNKYEDNEEYKEEVVEKPAQVTGLTIENIKGNTVNISWNKVSDADGYEIYLSKSNGKFQYKGTVYKNSATLSKLDYDTNYRVIIVSYKNTSNGTLYGKDSVYKVFKTEEEVRVVEQVQNLRVSANKNKVSLSWSKVNNADGYNIYVSKNKNNNFKYTKTTTAKSTSLNLDYNTTYYIQVRAYEIINGKEVEGLASTVRKVTTEQEEIKVPKVTNLKANVVGDTVKLTWNEVKGAVKYEIDFTVPGIGGSVKFTVYTNSRIISGLTEKRYAYTAKVRAYKYVDGKLVAGPYSNVSKFTGK